MANSSELYIGLMSGTSLDGVDAVLADMSCTPPRALDHFSIAFAAPLRETLRALNHPSDNELQRAALAANDLARHYAAAVRGLLEKTQLTARSIRALGCHGQTVRHSPEQGYTLQINNPSLLAELAGIDVVADLRSRDIAAGGQGAPLAPAFHAAVFRAVDQHRVILNLGGIANLTNLPPQGEIIGFDSGPANILLDAWCMQMKGENYDQDGAWAASGEPIPALLAELLATPYLKQKPPKSTGRELFHLDWLKQFLRPEYAAHHVQATLLEFTVQTVVDALRNYCDGARALYLCGGGAHNGVLRRRLQQLCAPLDIFVDTTVALGIAPQQVEGMAFAWLAQRRVQSLSGNLPSVTGAKHACVLGALYSAE